MIAIHASVIYQIPWICLVKNSIRFNTIRTNQTIFGNIVFCLRCSWKDFQSFYTNQYKTLLQTRMHSSRMRTACSSSRPGGLHQAPPQQQPHPLPGTRHSWEQISPGTRNPPLPGPGTLLWTECQTGVKILPCPKVPLRAVITHMHDRSTNLPVLYVNFFNTRGFHK